MWWTRDKTEKEGAKPQCPTCVTRPVLVQSGYGQEKGLKCPVCKALFDSKGIKYDPDAKTKTGSRKFSAEEEMLQEQQELWESLWRK